MAAETSKEGLVAVANDMLSKLHVSCRVQHWSDINADVFVTLLEGLLAESAPGIVRPAKTREDEIHNCQVVIDTLSTDILNTPLFHITGQAIVEGDTIAIGNLLDIMLGLMEYLLDKIGSDISTDNDDMQEEMEDPDRVTPTVIDDILERELGQDYRAPYSSGKAWLQSEGDMARKDQFAASAPPRVGSSSHQSDNTSELIALGQSAGSVSGAYRGVGETTADLIALGDSIYKKSPTKRRPATLPASGVQLTRQERCSWTDGQADILASGSGNSREEKESDQKPSAIPATTVPSQASRSHLVSHQGPSTVCTVPASNTADRLRSATPGSTHGTATGCGHELPVSGSSPGARDLFTADLLGTHRGLAAMSAPRIAAAPASASHCHGRRPDLRATAPADLGPTSTLSSDAAQLDSSLSSSVALPQPPALSQQPGSSDFVAVGQARPAGSALPLGAPRPGLTAPPPAPASAITCHLYHHFGNGTAPSSMSSTVPAAASGQTSAPAARSVLSTTAPATVPAATARDGQVQTYQNLQSLVQDTVDLSRAAVRTSPFKEHGTTQARHGAQQDGAVEDLSQHLSQWSLDRSGITHYRPGYGDLQDTTQASAVAGRQSILSPGKKTSSDVTRRKVSFLTSPGDTSLSTATTDIDRGGVRAASLAYSKPRSVRPSRTTGKKLGAATGKRVTEAQRNGVTERKSADMPARNVKDYMSKYYGHGQRLHSLSDGEIDYGSDRNEYSADGDISDLDSDFLSERYRELPRRLRKSVRFEEVLDDSAPGRMGSMRRKLKREDRKARMKADLIGQQYEDDLMDIEQDFNDALQKTRKKSQETETNYKKKVMKSHRPKDRMARKHSARTSVLYPRTRVRSGHHTSYMRRKRTRSASPGIGRPTERVVGQDIIPTLLEEFPFLYLSTETLRRLWQQSSTQVERLSKAAQEVRSKKSLAQCQIEEAERRQKMISNIKRKEVEHRQRLQDLKDRKRQQYQVLAQLRDKRHQSARARRYYEEYQVRMRSKMLKKRTKEELVFKRLFHEGIDIQKERIRELRKYAREQREQRAKRQKDELESQENYYRDQFNLLADLMAKERRDLEIREAAQAKILQQMQTELRHKMEGEIKNLQEQIFRDEDDVYFRELDADRLRQQLHMACYQAPV